MAKETIGIHPSFFRSERDRAYADPFVSFFREFCQNSTDANCSWIKIHIRKSDGGGCWISFADNGHGMTEEVLRDVYFKIGATTKGDSSTVGGFGRARILTCFSMDKYAIKTQDLAVVGQGATFEIRKTDYYRRGCKVVVLCRDCTAEQMEEALNKYLSLSQMNCDVFINGAKWKNWLHKNREIRSFSWGTVHCNKSGEYKGQVIVRVRGAMMFCRYTDAQAQIVLEINPEQSRNVLLANRDSLHYKYSSELDAFLSELASETRSALKEKISRKTVHLKGRGGLLAARRPRKTDGMFAVPVLHLKSEVSQPSDVVKLISAEHMAAAFAARQRDEEYRERDNIVNGKQSICPELFDVYIEDDVGSSPKLKRIIDNFNPKNWVVSYNGTQAFRKGADCLKLLMLWKVACEEAIEALYKAGNFDRDFSYSVGWVFSDVAPVTGARCKTMEDGSIFFLLNPVTQNGLLNFSLRKKNDLKKLMALAKHEVAHVACSRHTEEYANILTDIDCEFDETKTYRKMKEMLNSLNA